MSRSEIAFAHTPWVGGRSRVGAAAPLSGCPDSDVGRTIRCADTSSRKSRVVSRKPATLSQFEAAPIPTCVCWDAFCCRHSIGSLRERHPKYCTSASRPESGRCGQWAWSGSELYGRSGWQLYGPPRPSTKTQPLPRNLQTAGSPPFQANKRRSRRRRRRSGGSEHGHIAVPPCRCAATHGPAWFEFSAGGQDSVSGSKSGPGPSKTGDFAVLSHLQQLGCGEIKRRPREVHFSGCINESYAFHCSGGDFFVKINRTFSANDMFQGELEALRIMGLTSTVRIPKPLACGDLPETGSYIIMEYLPFRPFGMIQVDAQQKLGTLLGQMHTADIGTSNFGFPLSTRLGVLPLNNNGVHSWRDFFVEQRLKDRLEMVFSKLGDEVPELRAIGDRLLSRAMDLLDGVDCMPSVLHGDLWIGNSGLTRNGEVAIFDPACFVGHSEFDLAFRGWFPSQASGFPGFGDAFYDAYHEVVPQEPGFADRHDLYQLFHLINHLLIYGMEYYPHVMDKAKKLL